MTSSSSRARRFTLSVAFIVGIWGASCAGQAIELNGGQPDILQLPRLCMPVSYRHDSAAAPINTTITMLGDRYNEVSEALSGWNATGVPLVGWLNGRWEPVPCGDDTGLFYTVPLLARYGGFSAGRALDVFLLGMLIASAITGLVGLWLTSSEVRQRVIAVVPISVGTYLSYKMGDVYLFQGSVVLMLVPWLILCLKMSLRPLCRFLIVFLAGILLGLAQWVRTQSGSAVLVFFVVLVCFSSLRRFTKIFLSIILLFGMSLPLLYAQFQLGHRDRFLLTHRAGYRPPLNHHMFWHTTYLGLGFLTNPYVPAWRDSVAVEYARALDPTVIYGGKEYEALLRSRVVEIVHLHPGLVLDTVAAKIGVLACMLLLCLNIGLAAAISRRKPLGTDVAFGLAMATAALPGIIAIPKPQYVLGMLTLALYHWYYSVSFYIAGSSPHGAAGAAAVNFAVKSHSPQIESLLSTYPRTRPELAPRQRASYVEHYKSNRAANRGLAIIVAKLESWMHRRVSEGIKAGNLLEIGAGNLNHFPYLTVECVCDAVEPFRELWEGSPYRSRVHHMYSDLREVPVTSRYDSVFSVAVLEHLTDLPFILSRAGLLLREGGSFRAGFPSEGGLLWGLAWRFSTGIEYRLRRGLNYRTIMRHEHLNTASEILLLLEYFYESVEVLRFPLPFHHLSFYTTAIAQQPRLDRCRSFQAFRLAASVLTHE